MATKTLPITEARGKLTDLVDKAANQLEEYIITVKGKPKAVLMSSEEFEGWKETNEILSDPGLIKAIKEGEDDIKAGRVITFEDLKKELRV
jgi:prevent-host-death family protein